MSDLALPSPEDVRAGLAAGGRILEWWRKVEAYLKRRKNYVLFTGMEGVGKTVLFDFLSGKAYEKGYRPPAKSNKLERGRTADPGRPIGLKVIPGQSARPRMEAVERTLLGKTPPLGVVHVVANGFASIRGHESTEVIRKAGRVKSVADLQNLQRKREIEELRQVCGWLRDAHRMARQPSWLIVAVTKYDLFPDALADVRSEYGPGGRGEVVKLLDDLVRFVGADNFQWQAVPVCGWLEDFTFARDGRKSRFTPQQRDVLVEELGKLISGFCHGERG